MPKPKPDEKADAIDLEEDLGTRRRSPSRPTRTTSQPRPPMVTQTTSAPTKTRPCPIRLRRVNAAAATLTAPELEALWGLLSCHRYAQRIRRAACATERRTWRAGPSA